jgi:hypothetical protein
LAIAFALAAAICAGIGFRYVFLAGCTADLKTGLGNPLEALRLEEIGMQWLAGSTALFGLAIALCIVRLFRHSLPVALIEAVVPAAVVGVVLWMVAWEVEGYGVRSSGIYNGA